jgi:multidrug transporter EmrE-like cation transporter
MNVYWLMLFSAICISMVGQTLLKAGAQSDTFWQQILDWRTLIGLCVYGSASIFYIVALRKIPMSIALPCTAASYVVAVMIGHFFFGEALSPMRICAIALITSGVILLVI